MPAKRSKPTSLMSGWAGLLDESEERLDSRPGQPRVERKRAEIPNELPLDAEAEEVPCERCGKLVLLVAFERMLYMLDADSARMTHWGRRALRHELVCKKP